MTSLSTFCLEEHKGNPRGSTTAKAAQKGSTRLSSSVLSCRQQEALPAFSLPVPLQQVTTAPAHRHHIPGNDFHSSALSQRLPHTEDSQLCTNRLGKGNTDFPLQFHCAGPFILGYRPQWYIPTQPHRKTTTAAPDSPSWALPVDPSWTISDPILTAFMVESLNPYHWKGNDVRTLLAAHSIPYLPLCTGNYHTH